MNSAGLVVGWSNGGGLHAMYWVDTTGVSLQPHLPKGPSSAALDVNDAGEICGWMGLSPYPTFGASPFIWHNGKTTTLPLPDYAAANTGAATALNNRGDACGYFFVTHPEETYVRRACAWIDGECIDLGLLPGASASIALDINDAREVIGYCTAGPSAGGVGGFIWRDGVMHDLTDLLPPDLFNSASMHPRAINSAGQIRRRRGPSARQRWRRLPSHARAVRDARRHRLLGQREHR